MLPSRHSLASLRLAVPPLPMQDMIAFLREDLLHLFDEVGIDASKYDDRVEFEDPITKYDSIKGELSK